MRQAILLLVFLAWATYSMAQQSQGAKGFIGLGLADAPGAIGVLVGIVKPGGPADRAGVKPGDIITAINGTPVLQATRATSIVTSTAPSQTIRFSIIRKSGASSRRLTIPVVVGTSNEVGGSKPVAPKSVTQSPSHPQSPAAPSSPPAGPSFPARPLTVSGYVQLTDPLEKAFTVDVPSGWHSEAGLARRAALQINPYVRSLSPDKMTYLMLGEPTLPSFSPPSQMGNAIGHPEGTLYDAGLGGRAL